MKKHISILIILLMILIPAMAFAGFCGYLKADTSATLQLGPFVDDSDGNTAETGLTISQADVRLTKNGGNFAQKNESTSCTHDELGYYSCPIDTTDTNTEGRLKVVVHESGALLVEQTYQVVNANVFDSLYAAATTDYLQVDTIQVTGTSQTANDNGADINAILTDTNELQTDDIPGTLSTMDGKLDTIDGIVDDVLTDTGTTLQAELDGIQADTEDLQTQIGTAGDGLSAVPWNASWDAEVESEVDDAIGGGTGTALSAIPWNASWDAEVQSEAADALVAIHLDHLLSEDYDPASKPGTATALLNELVESDSGVSRFTENALEQAPSGTGASAATIADAVWDEVQADHVGAGTFGITASEIADILTDTNELQTDDIPGTLSTMDGKLDTIDGIVDDILTDTGTTLQAELDGIQADTEDLQTQIGTAGDGLSAVPWNASWDAEVESEVDDAIGGGTGTALSAIPWNASWDAEVQSEAADALTAYDPPTDTEMDTGHAAIVADTEDIQARLPAALVSGRMSADAVAISGSTDAADKLEASAETIITAAAAAGTLSTTQMTTTLTEATDDHYNGRIIIWTSGVLTGQATDITDYDGATKKLTFTAVTEAPSADDTFNII